MPKHSAILIFGGIPPSETRTPNSIVFSHKDVSAGHVVCAHLVSGGTDHRHPRWPGTRHARGAGPGPAQGTSGAAGAQAPRKRLVVLPTAAWGKGYRVRLRPLLRVRRMY